MIEKDFIPYEEALALKEAVNRMEYIGDMSDLGNEIGITVGHAYAIPRLKNIYSIG